MKVIRTVRLCKTEFLTTLRAQVRARHVTTLRSFTLDWNETLDALENHVLAAEALFGCYPEFRAACMDGGYLMGCDVGDGEKEEAKP